MGGPVSREKVGRDRVGHPTPSSGHGTHAHMYIRHTHTCTHTKTGGVGPVILHVFKDMHVIYSIDSLYYNSDFLIQNQRPKAK